MPLNSHRRQKRGNMLKPEEIMIPEFTRGFKGYNQQEVDNCINTLITNYRELYFKYAETEEKLAVIAEKYKETSKRAGIALNDVKAMSAAIIDEAQAEAEKIVTEAEEKAKLANAAMKESCSGVLASYVAAFEEEKRKFIAMEEKSRAFRESLIEAYQNHLSEINEQFPAMSAQEISEVSFKNEASEVFGENLANARKAAQQND